jgi:hypothetical protein
VPRLDVTRFAETNRAVDHVDEGVVARSDRQLERPRAGSVASKTSGEVTMPETVRAFRLPRRLRAARARRRFSSSVTRSGARSW